MEKKRVRVLICVLMVGLIANLAIADIETGLVAYWPFEEGEGATTTADVTGHGHDGVFHGTPEWDSGPAGFGGALLFDVGSSGDGIECGTACAPSAGTGKFTLAIWAYWQRTETTENLYRHFMTKADGWGRDLMMWQWELFGGATSPSLTDKIGISCGDVGTFALSAGTMPVNEWVHLAVTFDGTVARLFINGVADLMGPTHFAIGTKTDAQFYIGVNRGYDRSFDGYLDEARVYSRALIAEDIMQLVVLDPDYNFAPQTDAGDYQSLLWPGSSLVVQLDGTVSDDGRPYQDPPVDPCTPVGLTFTWSKVSGPGNVTFSPSNDIEDPCVTFSAAGMYELRLRGYDGEKDACDVVAIYIRSNDDPIAHWDFDKGSGLTVNDDSANNNEGDLSGDPEPDWVSGWVGNNALEFYGETDPDINSYVDITTDSVMDPNLDNLRYEISLSAWVKTTETGTVIVADGNNTWRLGIRSSEPAGRLFLTCDGTSGGDLDSVRLVNDDYWHHVAAVYDGSTVSLHIDGVLDSSSEKTGLINVNDLPVTIGARCDDATTVSHSFNGLIDDVRVYTFGISDTEVAALAAMGDLVPVVDAGESQVFIMQDGYLQLDGTVTDDGEPEPAMLVWSKTSGSGDADFSDTAIEDPCVTFSEADTYVLRLTADDTIATVYDEVTITVEDPICQDVIDDGLLIASDFSGPEGTPDCRVNLYDFAVFAEYWFRCNNPQDPACEFPY